MNGYGYKIIYRDADGERAECNLRGIKEVKVEYGVIRFFDRLDGIPILIVDSSALILAERIG